MKSAKIRTSDGGLRKNTIVNVCVYCRVRQNTAVLRHRFQCKRCSFFVVYDTAPYDRNTAHTKWVLLRPVYGRKFVGYGRLRHRARPFTVVYDLRNDRPGNEIVTMVAFRLI